MSNTFQEKVVLVTGGGTGIGKETCLCLASEGAKIAINYSKSEAEAVETGDLVRTLGGEPMLVRADVADDRQVRQMVTEVAEKFGTIHYLVNNAGFTNYIDMSDLEAVTDAIWDRLMAVNLKGIFYTARAVSYLMKANGFGSIVNLGSIAGVKGSGSSLPYAVSKAAIHGLTRSLAHALAPTIRVNCVAPGPVATRWWDGKEERMTALSGTLLLKRVSTPEDIARLIVAILQQESMTGQIVGADNGLSL